MYSLWIERVLAEKLEAVITYVIIIRIGTIYLSSQTDLFMEKSLVRYFFLFVGVWINNYILYIDIDKK